jgi:hypothetical protein
MATLVLQALLPDFQDILLDRKTVQERKTISRKGPR